MNDLFFLMAQAAPVSADIFNSSMQYGFAGMALLELVLLGYLFLKLIEVMKATNDVILKNASAIDSNTATMARLIDKMDRSENILDDMNKQMMTKPCIACNKDISNAFGFSNDEEKAPKKRAARD